MKKEENEKGLTVDMENKQATKWVPSCCGTLSCMDYNEKLRQSDTPSLYRPLCWGRPLPCLYYTLRPGSYECMDKRLSKAIGRNNI